MTGIVSIFIVLGLSAYLLRLFVDYLTKRHATRMAKIIVEEIKKIILLDDEALKDVKEFMKSEQNQEINEYIKKGK